MIPQERNKRQTWTNKILVIVTLGVLLYVVYSKGLGFWGFNKSVVLQTTDEILTLDEKERTVVGINEKQIYKVTANGINTYNWEKNEIWSDTFSMEQFIVKQKAPYIAIADKQGKSLVLYTHKGRQCEIITTHPIVYFSVNESGGVTTIESQENTYITTAYDKTGKKLCWRVSYTSTDGYPTAAILSPDNSLLIMSYVSVDEPQVVSSVLAMKVAAVKNEEVDNIAFGYKENNNLVYDLEYINKSTWVCVGDRAMTWYNNQGMIKGKQNDLSLVFVPEVIKMSRFGTSYFPVIYSERPTQNVVHRQDQLAYYDENGKQTYQLALNGGVENYYADDNGVIVKVAGTFKGYNRLCNQVFEYEPAIDINQVIYMPGMNKGIAISKSKVYLLVPKKEEQ